MPVSISYDFIQFQQKIPSKNFISDRKMNASWNEALVIKEPWSLKDRDRDDVFGNTDSRETLRNQENSRVSVWHCKHYFFRFTSFLICRKLQYTFVSRPHTYLLELPQTAWHKQIPIWHFAKKSNFKKNVQGVVALERRETWDRLLQNTGNIEAEAVTFIFFSVKSNTNIS